MCHHVVMYDGRDKNRYLQINGSIKCILNKYGGVMQNKIYCNQIKINMYFRVCITPPVPNYKSFQESQRVKLSQSLTKIIERNTKIYEIKQIYYENIANKECNGT